MRPILRGKLEDKVDMLLYIGRDEDDEGKSGFNIDIELDQENRRDTFEYLKREGLIEVFNEEKVSDYEHDVTFVDCKLTAKGKGIYKRIEMGYTGMINAVKPDLGGDEV